MFLRTVQRSPGVCTRSQLLCQTSRTAEAGEGPTLYVLGVNTITFTGPTNQSQSPRSWLVKLRLRLWIAPLQRNLHSSRRGAEDPEAAARRCFHTIAASLQVPHSGSHFPFMGKKMASRRLAVPSHLFGSPELKSGLIGRASVRLHVCEIVATDSRCVVEANRAVCAFGASHCKTGFGPWVDASGSEKIRQVLRMSSNLESVKGFLPPARLTAARLSDLTRRRAPDGPLRPQTVHSSHMPSRQLPASLRQTEADELQTPGA